MTIFKLITLSTIPATGRSKQTVSLPSLPAVDTGEQPRPVTVNSRPFLLQTTPDSKSSLFQAPLDSQPIISTPGRWRQSTVPATCRSRESTKIIPTSDTSWESISHLYSSQVETVNHPCYMQVRRINKNHPYSGHFLRVNQSSLLQSGRDSQPSLLHAGQDSNPYFSHAKTVYSQLVLPQAGEYNNQPSILQAFPDSQPSFFQAAKYNSQLSLFKADRDCHHPTISTPGSPRE